MYNCTDTENSEFVEKGLDVRIDGNTFSDNTMKKRFLEDSRIQKIGNA